ncbi:MAG: hypothetical protein H6674_05610 [Dehalococcoidia bacterium]|nr:hypothetical protein [Dehalococcoidia bacterium]
MADEQHTPDDASNEEDEAPQKRGGLGRFASRFRRVGRSSVEESAPHDAASDDVPPTSDDDAETLPTLAPELDLSITPRPAQLARPPQEPETASPAASAESPPESPNAPQREALTESQTEPGAWSPPFGSAPEPETEPEPEHETAEPPGQPSEPAPPSSPWPHPVDAEPPPVDAEPPTDETPEPPVAEPPAEPLPAPAVPVAAVETEPGPQPVLLLEEEPNEPAPMLAPVPTVEASDEARTARIRPSGISAHLVVTSVLATMVMLAFLLIEPSPRWLLLLGAAAVVFGLDGTLRQTWREPFSLGQETAPFLFVPALYVMAVPVLIEHNISGELVLLVGLGAGLGFGALAWAEVASVRPMAEEYDQARLVVTANTYLTGFAVFSLTYVFELTLPAAILATSITAAMLAVEVLREGEIDPLETLGLSLVAGFILGEMRWLLYYVPLDTYLAGLTLLLAFYLATGLLHSHVIRALNRVVAAEYSGIAAAGLALVILARAAGLA